MLEATDAAILEGIDAAILEGIDAAILEGIDAAASVPYSANTCAGYIAGGEAPVRIDGDHHAG